MTEREEQLERRVRRLDRSRRRVALAVGIAVGALTFTQMGDAMGVEWPQVATNAFTVAFGVLAWLVCEIAIAWMTAVWESELDRLLALRGLPRAELTAAASRRWRRRR